VGNVLIEATSPDFLRRAGKPEVMPNADANMVNIGPFAARLGILRLFRFVPVDDDLPERQREELIAFYSSKRDSRGTLSAILDVVDSVRSNKRMNQEMTIGPRR
jgi:hypothetical protein